MNCFHFLVDTFAHYRLLTKQEREAALLETLAYEEEFCEFVYIETERGRVGVWVLKQL